MNDTELVDYLVSYNIHRLPDEELALELDFAKRERDLATNPDYKESRIARVKALTAESERRQWRRRSLKKSPVTMEFIQDLKSRVDIRDIFNYLGILVIPDSGDREKYQCPAHPDWNPSGFIFKADQHYHCFQCKAHGDVFDAVRAFGNKTTFIEAVDVVAGYLGIPMPKREGYVEL